MEPILKALAELLRERGWSEPEGEPFSATGLPLYGWTHPDIPGRRYPMNEAVTAQMLLEISDEVFTDG